jgi:hypothetical protein
MEEWFKMERKNIQGVSIVWKELVKVFPLIGKCSAWKVGRGNKVRIGEDLGLDAKGILNFLKD